MGRDMGFRGAANRRLWLQKEDTVTGPEAVLRTDGNCGFTGLAEILRGRDTE